MSAHLLAKIHNLTTKKDDLDKFQETDKIIVVLGACGAGKTHFINTSVGEKVLGVGDDLKIKTRDIQYARRNIPGLGDVVLVDTPALPAPDAHAMSPEEIEKNLGKWLESVGKVMYGPKVNRRAHVSGVIYLHRITDNKLTDRVFLHRGMLRTLCGERYAKRTALVTTMWETLGVGDKGPEVANPGAATAARKEKRETEIKRRHWDLMEGEGAPPMHRHNGSKESALAAIKVLLERDEVDQPMILLLGERSEDQIEFIRDIASASNIQIKAEILEDMVASNSSTIFQNIPITNITNGSAEDPPSVASPDANRNIAIIALPPVYNSQCAAEVKRLQRIHGRDVVACLYLTSTAPSQELKDGASYPPVLVDAMSAHRNVVIASKVADGETTIPDTDPQSTLDGTTDGTSGEHPGDFGRKWNEWKGKYSAEEGVSSFHSAPILEYGKGRVLSGPIEVVSTIWQLHESIIELNKVDSSSP